MEVAITLTEPSPNNNWPTEQLHALHLRDARSVAPAAQDAAAAASGRGRRGGRGGRGGRGERVVQHALAASLADVHSAGIDGEDTANEVVAAATAPPAAAAQIEVDRGGCNVCMNGSCTHAFAPCGHQCVCRTCADLIIGRSGQCPVCRADIMMALPIFKTG